MNNIWDTEKDEDLYYIFTLLLYIVTINEFSNLSQDQRLKSEL